MNNDLLHVAFPGACNTQQAPPNHATGDATGAQQTNLKALADAVLARNKRCNNRATEGRKGTQQTFAKTPPFVASAQVAMLSENICEHLEERAAIQEYDSGLPRERAEAQAKAALRVYEYRLTDNGPDGPWLILLAPGCDLAEAERSLKNRFGAGRVLTVRERNRTGQSP